MNRTIQKQQERAIVARMIQTLCLIQLPLVALWYLLKGKDDGSEPNLFRSICYVGVSWLIPLTWLTCIATLLK